MKTPQEVLQYTHEEFFRYYDTAFRASDPGVMAERSKLLKEPGVVFGDPFIEPLPEYPTAGERDGIPRSITESIKSAGGSEFLAELADQVIFAEPSGLYEHQEEALVESFKNQRNLAITSGTGSGKTEAFLLPILARLTQEAETWPAPPPDAEGGHWWKTTANRDPQRAVDGHRPAAVRALVMFPMNALVEDQLVRLRSYLDSDESQAIFDKHCSGNRFYFGRYTGKTPVSGDESKSSR
ncbi:uncharacterized protein METZ01_LOCUS429132, partial [marine metagenome]